VTIGSFCAGIPRTLFVVISAKSSALAGFEASAVAAFVAVSSVRAGIPRGLVVGCAESSALVGFESGCLTTVVATWSMRARVASGFVVVVGAKSSALV
jgi:hypothetical protein